MNIILAGFMGSGKSSVGSELARRTGYGFVDTDDLIVEKEGRSIASIFREEGEAYFRRLEQSVVAEVASRRAVVVSTGGGVIEHPENVKALKASGVMVWLKTVPEVILRRTMTEGGTRPLLDVEEPLKEIRKILKRRSPLYREADLELDTSYITVGEAVDDLCDRLALSGRRVRVELGARSYDILIGKGVLHGLGGRVLGLRPTRVAVVSNPTVYGLYGDEVEGLLRDHGINPLRVLIPDGESYKDLLWLYKILGELLSAGFDRQSLIIALGGGVIGDIAGFAAATYMRGIRCLQVPTTLLSQVDSSVGGKTGVNHPLGKNMIGSFFQPSLVIMDMDLLRTLPVRELRAGLAEIIKYGVIRDSELFELMERERDDIMKHGPSLEQLIVRSCRIKADVVNEDEREAGVRAILNFGHTFGHAVETLTGYKRLLHGEAVAIGMRVASDLAVRLKLIPRPEAARIRKLIQAYDLPVSIPGDISTGAMMDAMMQDKKAVGKKMRFVLPTAVGRVEIRDDISEAAVRKAIEGAREGVKSKGKG